MPTRQALVDAGPLIAYYNRGDEWHSAAVKFFENYTGLLITSEPVITEVMYNLSADRRVQNEFLSDVAMGLFFVESLRSQDFIEIAQLNIKYKDLPGDFADLSIVVLSARLNIVDVVSLDSDFDVYRSLKKKFNQLFPKWE